jgi:hypothetical protein
MLDVGCWMIDIEWIIMDNGFRILQKLLRIQVVLNSDRSFLFIEVAESTFPQVP